MDGIDGLLDRLDADDGLAPEDESELANVPTDPEYPDSSAEEDALLVSES